MGGIVKAIGSLLGGGSAPKANVSSANDEVADEQAKAKNARSALLETAGGAAGDPLQTGQVQSRDTLFGN